MVGLTTTPWSPTTRYYHASGKVTSRHIWRLYVRLRRVPESVESAKSVRKKLSLIPHISLR